MRRLAPQHGRCATARQEHGGVRPAVCGSCARDCIQRRPVQSILPAADAPRGMKRPRPGDASSRYGKNQLSRRSAAKKDCERGGARFRQYRGGPPLSQGPRTSVCFFLFSRQSRCFRVYFFSLGLGKEILRNFKKFLLNSTRHVGLSRVPLAPSRAVCVLT